MFTARLRIAALAATLATGPAVPASATVFYARNEALTLAFPDAERTEAKDYFLTAAQRKEIEERGQAPLDSNLLTLYTGWHGDQMLGYAVFDTHTVRTLSETFLIVLTPAGTIAATHVCAFYEPPEYMASSRWMAQFRAAGPTDDLRVGRGIAGITGATLTSQAVTGAVRRALAVYAVLLKGH